MTALLTIAKLTLTATFLYILSAIAKRSTLFAALLGSLPVTAIITGILLYWETGDSERIANFTSGVLWLIYPSLVFYIAFPFLLRRGISYSMALGLSVGIMMFFYAIYFALLRWFSIKL